MIRMKNYITSCKNSFKSLPNPEWYVKQQLEKPPKTTKTRIKSIVNGFQLYIETWNWSLRGKTKSNRDEEGNEKTLIKKEYVEKYGKNLKQNIDVIQNVTEQHLKSQKQKLVEGSKEIQDMMPAKESMENSIRDWLYVFRLSSTEFYNGFQDGKDEIESSTDKADMDWLNPLFNDMEEFTSQIKDDFQNPNFNRDEFIQKYGKNFKQNVSFIKNMTEDEFEKGKDILLKNENVENILENEQIKHYTDKIASNEYVEKYSKNFIKNAHTIKELGEEKFFNEENDLKEIDVILVDDKNKKV